MSSIARPSLAPYPQLSLPEVLARSARRFGGRQAAVCGSRSVTFLELEDLCSRIASGLASLGLKPGDRVALMGQNSIDFIACFFGVLRAGGVVVPFSPAYSEREIAGQLEDCAASFALTDSSLAARFEGASRGNLPADRLIALGPRGESGGLCLQDLVKTATGEEDMPPVSPSRPAVIAYSSGTTGVPKGVMLSHENLVANLAQFRHQDPVPITHEDIFLNHLPFAHIYGMNVLMAEAVFVGATQVIMSRFDPEELLRLISARRATLLFTVPPVLLALNRDPEIRKHDLSSLRYVNSGGAPLPPEVAREFRALTAVPVKQGYGLTETSPAINTDFYARPEVESIGPPLSDTEERVVDVDDPDKVLGPGEVGELVVRGPQVMMGYWRDTERTRQVLRDGWFYTGDLARMDERGYVYIVGRTKEMIKYKGFTVAPSELESLLLEHPQVQDCAVVGVPDPEAGEIPQAFVVRKPGGTADCEALMEFLRGKVAGYKRVRRVEFVASIPRSPSGKILRRRLLCGPI